MEEKTKRLTEIRTIVKTTAFFITAFGIAACASKTPAASSPRPVEQLMNSDPHTLAGAVVDDFDVDDDRRISADEFTLATIRVFESLDRDGNLKLDREECAALAGRAGMERADSNHDGAISLSEIMGDQNKEFRKYDRDSGGYLAIDELEAFAADRLAGR